MCMLLTSETSFILSNGPINGIRRASGTSKIYSSFHTMVKNVLDFDALKPRKILGE